MLPLLVFLVFIFLVFVVPGFRILMQFERGVVFTLGKYSYTLSPGFVWVVPFIQTMERIDMRIETVDIPKQEVITKDNIPVNINAVVYFRVKRPEDVVMKISDYVFAVIQLTQSALKDVIGTNDLDTVLSERKRLGEEIKLIVDEASDKWGIDIESINVQEIELPEDMKRAMAKQAEAERNRRAMIITADGEVESSKKMLEAAQTLAKSPMTMQLKTLQTIKDVSTSQSQKVILFPVELMEILKKK
ncbi:MAG: SPFH domain-containing protein [Alphaproteobacteria bacterium]|nr:SPFH domain-containing protein [Alphaproteobacteria bacterium]